MAAKNGPGLGDAEADGNGVELLNSVECGRGRGRDGAAEDGGAENISGGTNTAGEGCTIELEEEPGARVGDFKRPRSASSNFA